MNRHILIIIGIALVLTGFLYSRPKVVVKDEAKANRDKVTEKKTAETDNHEGEKDGGMHAPELSATQQKQISDLKAKLSASDKKSQSNILLEIANVFVNANRIDSAGFYMEKIAIAESNTNNWMNAGNTYFQAYNLALHAGNIESLATKTQLCYKKVLELNPRQLLAKTNMAMTYVQTASPMQAIGLLREVIEDDPNYEPALMNLGVLSMQSNQFDKAADRFQQVLKNNPKNVNAQFALGYSLIELGKKAEAKVLFEDLKNRVKEPTLLEEVKKALESLK